MLCFYLYISMKYTIEKIKAEVLATFLCKLLVVPIILFIFAIGKSIIEIINFKTIGL